MLELKRYDLIGLAGQFEVDDIDVPFRTVLRDVFLSPKPILGHTFPCWCARMRYDGSFCFSTLIHGDGIKTTSVDAFERDYLPFVLDHHACSVIRFHFVQSDDSVEAWLYIRGCSLKESLQSALAYSVMES